MTNASPPPLNDSKAQEDESLGAMLMKPKYKAMLVQAATGTKLDIDRFIRIMSTAVMKNPTLQKCTPSSMFGSMMVFAALGIEPNTPLGHGWLVPYKNKAGIYEAQPIIGYRGHIDLARRSGSIVNIHADVVYEGDEFSFEYGSNQHLRHVPRGDRTGRKALWGYCHAKLADGEAFEVLPIQEVDKAKNSSQSYRQVLRFKDPENSEHWKYQEAIWVKHEHAMRAKTMVLRLAKMLPMSIAMMNAISVENAIESGAINVSDFTRKDPAEMFTAAATSGYQEPSRPESEEGEPETYDRPPVNSNLSQQEASAPKPAARRGRKPQAIEHQPAPEMPIVQAQPAAAPVAAQPAASPPPPSSQPVMQYQQQSPPPSNSDDDDLFMGD